MGEWKVPVIEKKMRTTRQAAVRMYNFMFIGFLF
jgi:hypothetical protein